MPKINVKKRQEELPSFMELLKHLAKHHFKEQSDTNYKKSEEDMFITTEESCINKHGGKVSEDKMKKTMSLCSKNHCWKSSF